MLRRLVAVAFLIASAWTITPMALAAAPPQAGEIGAFCSILSGTLAKHEYREENNLFPEWRRAWARLAAVEQKEMMARAQKLLGEG